MKVGDFVDFLRGYCGFKPKFGVFFFGVESSILDIMRLSKHKRRFRFKQIALMEPGQIGSSPAQRSERACYPGRRPVLGVLARRRLVQVKFDVFFASVISLNRS